MIETVRPTPPRRDRQRAQGHGKFAACGTRRLAACWIALAAFAQLPAPSAASEQDDCLMLHAAAMADDDVVRAKGMLELGVDVDCRDHQDSDTTPLMKAALGAGVGVAQLLIEHGADINAVDQHGWTALRYATSTRDQLAKAGPSFADLVKRLTAIIDLLRSKGAH
jgi:hypothetical protein